MNKQHFRKKKAVLALTAVTVLLAGCGGSDKTETADAAQTVAKTQMVNPIKASSLEEFESMGIHLELPDNENWIQEATCTTIDKKTAQIRFYDVIAGADMVLRAGKTDIPAMAGIYESFDDVREEHWQAVHAETGDTIDIRMQYAVSEHKVKGVLLSWSFGDFNYTLWGVLADEEQDPSSMAKTAMYVAERVK